MSPLFDWQCLDCLTNGAKVIYPDLPKAPELCEICDGVAFRKLPAAPAIRFKGDGFQTPSAADQGKGHRPQVRRP